MQGSFFQEPSCPGSSTRAVSPASGGGGQGVIFVLATISRVGAFAKCLQSTATYFALVSGTYRNDRDVSGTPGKKLTRGLPFRDQKPLSALFIALVLFIAGIRDLVQVKGLAVQSLALANSAGTGISQASAQFHMFSIFRNESFVAR
jgi:hypothetical protein